MTKKIISIIISLTIIFGCSMTAQASESPYYFEKPQYGYTLTYIKTKFTTKTNKNYYLTRDYGFYAGLSSHTMVKILGLNTKNSELFYVQKTIRNTKCYGYINRKYVRSDNSTNFTLKKSAPVTSSYNHKKYSFTYYEYEGMPFYKYYQFRSGSIKGLGFNNSCGPHSVAAAYSAVFGRVIMADDVMLHMSYSALTPNKKGSSASTIIASTQSYFEKKYRQKIVTEKIQQKDIFHYLKNGYIVVAGVENIDKLNVLTIGTHYVVFVGYDNVGNIMTVNSNGRTNLFDGLSESRIKLELKPSKYYNENVIAFKYKFDDSFDEYKTPKKIKLTKTTTVYTHKDAGKYYYLPAKTQLEILGSYKGSDKSYYCVKYKNYKFFVGCKTLKSSCKFIETKKDKNKKKTKKNKETAYKAEKNKVS